MADVVPFVCWRPPEELSGEVAAAPYDTVSRAEAAEEIARHPLSFLRIDRPAALFDPSLDEYEEQVYAAAREELDAWYEQGVMLPDSPDLEPAYFIYRLTQGSHIQTGLVACASVADYQSGVIKRHENTRALKERDRVEHIKTLEAHTGPVLLTYPPVRELDDLLEELTRAAVPEAATEAAPHSELESASQPAPKSTLESASRPAPQPTPKSTLLYDFVAPDGVRHEFWRLDSRETTEQIRACFAQIPALYIADGHHRAAAAMRVAEWYTAEQRAGQAAAQYFLVALFASNELRVLDYNRVVSDLAGLGPQELLTALTEVMDIEVWGTEPFRPTRRGELGMYLDGTWYQLRVREASRPQDVVDGLDVALLQSTVLAPILHIEDPRSDPRITYLSGIRGLAELASLADETGGVAFALYPCSLDELFAVADEGRLMPPKSTWFEPKPRSGLAIHRIR